MLTQLIVSGLLLGCAYGLISMGLSLIWGVMGIVNFAHGAFVMLAMYVSYWMNVYLRLDPIQATPLVMLAMFVVGVAVYWLVVGKVLNGPFLSRLLVTFGLGIFLTNAAQFLWTPDYKTIRFGLSGQLLSLPAFVVEAPKLVACLGSILVSVGVYWFIKRTKTGLAIQAISMDRMAASLMGINLQRLNAVAFGLGIASAGAAGSLLASFYYIFPDVGTMFGLIALVAVALGGFGSIEGAFVGAVVIGLIETVGGFAVGPAYKYALIFVAYLVTVVVRPRGLLGWGAE
ncbi:MAG: branched-chain amino acid ABC transporter permease [Betaproteobacteria bacterium]